MESAYLRLNVNVTKDKSRKLAVTNRGANFIHELCIQLQSLFLNMDDIVPLWLATSQFYKLGSDFDRCRGLSALKPPNLVISILYHTTAQCICDFQFEK